MKIIVKRVCLTIIQTHPLSCPMPYRSYKAYRFYKAMISLSLFDQYHKVFAGAPEKVGVGDAQDVFLFGILLQLV